MTAIYKALAAINIEIGAVTKDKKNPQQGYKFRGIDDMYNALHDLFAKHSVFITSEVIASKREERTTKGGGVLIYTIATCKFNFYTVDGSSVSSTLEGEAMDSGDKSTNKAMSAALKYALMQMFLIPTEEKLDTEYNDPKPEAKMPEPPKPSLKEGQLNKIIERIRKGEIELKEKVQIEFNLTNEQLKAIQSA